jgi:hypothetical protein
MSRKLFPGKLCPRFLRVKHRIAKALRETVDGLARTKQVQPKPSLVESALRGLTRSVQFLA